MAKSPRVYTSPSVTVDQKWNWGKHGDRMADASTDHVEEISDGPQTTVRDKSEKIDDSKNVLPDAEYSHIKNPEPWRYEHWIPGGYSQSRMLRFKNPSTMYKAINFFACVAICFYGYDQGVMSMVNFNHDYQKLMGIYPPEGSSRTTTAEGGIVAVYYGGYYCLWVVLGAALQTSAYNITWMCFGRVLAGIGVGAIDCVIPVWSAEVSSHSARGAFLALEFVMIFPLTVRAKGGAWFVVGWSIGNGVVTMIPPFLFQAIGHGTLLLLAGLNVFVIPFLILLYPETAGRSLEQMDVFFDNADSWNVFTASKGIWEKGFDDWQWTKTVPTRNTPVD
ncbi:hypothetical protein N7508_010528 [Penicillium antarcticum]|uniref:uncharacterized protein n=1 Tax=Penicillium antarcticum TaxID=416450 RepID=UPI00239A5C12|nr:uncharacterized protein N7508_010528 [Penicillium antarcticum]KAJ5295707.1 hypothetical protein N7508_010528 [Penicillium antarcticum]